MNFYSMKMKQNTVALLVAASFGVAATGKADLTWQWTLSSLDGGTENVLDYGSGTFTTTSAGISSGGAGYNYVVTGATGNFDGIPVEGVPSFSEATGGGWDQILFPYNFNPAGAPVDGKGLVLALNNMSTPYAGLYSPGPGGTYGVGTVVSGTLTNISLLGDNYGKLQLTITPAPESSQVVSMLGLAGLGGVSLLARMRRRK